MVGWHRWFNGHEFEQIPGDSEGQGSLVCWSPWGFKESDTTEQLNNNEQQQILPGVSLLLRSLNSQGLHSAVPVISDPQILCTCRKESSFDCLFFLGVCCLIVGHFKSIKKQNCSLLVVQTHPRLVFLFSNPLLMLALCLTCCFRVWSISEFQASSSSCTTATLGYGVRSLLFLPGSPYFFHLF